MSDGHPSSSEPRAGWLLRWARHPAGAVVLVLFALLEATVFPAPTEALLIALVLARPGRAWRLGALATAASVVGGVVGYHLGLAFFDQVARPVLDAHGLLGKMGTLSDGYRHNALLALMTSGYTPIPYMLYTAVAGASDVGLPTFVAGSLVGRGLKYLPIAAAAHFLGPAVHRVLGRYTAWAAVLVTVVLVVWLLVR